MTINQMKISDVTSCSDWTLACDVYDQTTHTTSSVTITNFGSYVTDKIARNYNDRVFINTSSQPTITPTTAFKNCWDMYKIANQENINRMYSGLVALYYNPIENYEGNTTQTWTYGNQTNTINNGKTKSESNNATFTDTSKNYEATYENTNENSPVFTNKDTVEHGAHIDTVTTEQLTDATNTLVKGNDTFTEYKHGNLGVLTSAQALEFEKKIRSQSFMDWVIEDFISKNTYYCSIGFGNNVNEVSVVESSVISWFEV